MPVSVPVPMPVPVPDFFSETGTGGHGHRYGQMHENRLVGGFDCGDIFEGFDAEVDDRLLAVNVELDDGAEASEKDIEGDLDMVGADVDGDGGASQNLFGGVDLVAEGFKLGEVSEEGLILKGILLFTGVAANNFFEILLVEDGEENRVVTLLAMKLKFMADLHCRPLA